MIWEVRHRFDQECCLIADRHYNRRKVGSPQFVPPGRCLVLLAKGAGGKALWVTSWPFPQYVKHRWPGAWVNSLFRNEGAGRASDLIRDALAATSFYCSEPPALGLVTFVDTDQVRGKQDPGHCYIIAGGRRDGETQGGLVAIRFAPEKIPPAAPAHGMTLRLAV